MRIGFYAPLKSPRHPVPSGDRRVAQLLWQALERGGHTPILASELRVYDPAGDVTAQAVSERAAAREVARLLDQYRRAPDTAPALWFTYHNYYKAPDLLGPTLARDLGIPYVIAEASHAPKRAAGPWASWHARAASATQAADRLLCFTALDRAMLAKLTPAERLVDLPAFLDTTPYRELDHAEARASVAARSGLDPAQPWLVAVAMMRQGDKLESYRRLAAALHLIDTWPWQLLVIGDGEARIEVAAALAPFGRRVAFLGAMPPVEIPSLLAAGDIYVWPAANEAFGMALLEAQAAGLPVVAGRVRGVPDVVRENETALLTAETAESFADALRRLLADRPLRDRMALAARHFAFNDRGLESAAARLDRALRAAAAR